MLYNYKQKIRLCQVFYFFIVNGDGGRKSRIFYLNYEYISNYDIIYMN